VGSQNVVCWCTVLYIFLSHVPNFLASAGRNGKLQSNLIFCSFFCGLHPVTPNSDQNLIFPHDSLHKESISRMVPSMFFSTLIFIVKPLLSSPLLSRHSLLRGHPIVSCIIFFVKIDLYSTATSMKQRRSLFGFPKCLILL